MTACIMPLDMLKLRRAAERLLAPIQAPHPAVQRRVPRSDVPHVAFEMLHVDGVEADDGRVEPDVGFGDVRAEVVWARRGGGLLGQVGFGAVEGGEEGGDGGFVGGLRSVLVWGQGRGYFGRGRRSKGGEEKRGGGGVFTARNRFCRRRC